LAATLIWLLIVPYVPERVVKVLPKVIGDATYSVRGSDLGIDLHGICRRNGLVRFGDKRGWTQDANISRLKRLMEKGKVVSFDIFDTVLHRKVAEPTHLFKVVELMLCPRLRAAIAHYSQERIAAEAEAWRRARESRPARQITLSDIFAVLQEKHALAPQDVSALYALEVATELRFTYADPMFLRLHADAVSMGLKVIFLSDMYLPSTCLRDMLQRHGFSNPSVFVSAEEGGNKASGRLYGLVARKLGLAPDQFLHFGDKFYADYLRARWAGWRAVHVDVGTRTAGPVTVTNADQICIGIGKEVVRKNKLDRAANPANKTDASFWNDFGYEVAGPVYFHFILWLYHQALRDGIHRLLLCSRDGFPLLRGFEILRDKWKLHLETPYFFASRRLFNLATIQDLRREDLDFLLMPNPGLKLRDFVERLGLDPEAQAPALLQLGFTSLDQQLVHSGFGRFIEPTHRHRLELWLQSCREDLLAKAQEERDVVLDYFREIEPGRSDTAVVDVGWKATVCVSMTRLLKKMDARTQPRTYFFGTYKQAHRLIDAGTQLNSFFFHLGKPRETNNIVASHEGIIEMLFHAPHGSLVGLKRGPKGIEPVYGICEYDEGMLQQLEGMTAGAHRFVEDMADLLPPDLASGSGQEDIRDLLLRLTRHPTLEEATHLGKVPYRVSYGDQGTVQPLAEPTKRKPYSLRTDLLAYERSPWKEAYLAQVSLGRRLILRIASFIHAISIALTSKTVFASIRWALFRS
jgi:predicted HAD superfamily hydrolase